jgi:hypothetical protein
MGFRRGLEHIRKYLPLPTQPAAEKAFTTYKNYLLHLERGLGGVYGIGSTLFPVSSLSCGPCQSSHRSLVAP